MKYQFNIKLKRSLLVVLILSAALTVVAQKTARDYYLPAPKKNKATFSVPETYENQSQFTRVIHYLKKGDQFEVVETTWFNDKWIRTEKRTIELMPSEVRLLKLRSTTEREKDKITLYDPPKIIMKVPGIGDTLAWSYKEANGQKTNFIADWIKFKLNNVNTRAVRITETITLSSGALFKAKRIYYYMEGTGLWKMEGEKGEMVNTICEFVKLEYDSTAQK